MNKEYEYSFKVKDVHKFIEYCVSHNYKKIEDYEQIRTLYKNGGKIMARITKNIYEDKTEEVLNFKDDNLNNDVLNVCRESEDLIITDENKNFVKSLIEILDLNNKKVLERHRVTFENKNVKFEIDEYTSPKMKVVAIEGDKKQVEQIYKEIENIINENRID